MLCWQTQDILFTKLKSANYKEKKQKYGADTLVKHRKYNPRDYRLFEYFNQTFHEEIRNATDDILNTSASRDNDQNIKGSDFSREVQYQKALTAKVTHFCEPFYSLLKNNSRNIYKMYTNHTKMIVPRTSWGEAFNVDLTFCINLIVNEDVFRNLLLVRQYPQTCDNILHKKFSVNRFETVPKSKITKRKPNSIGIHSGYCDRGQHLGGIPLTILAEEYTYDWDSLIPVWGVWKGRKPWKQHIKLNIL